MTISIVSLWRGQPELLPNHEALLSIEEPDEYALWDEYVLIDQRPGAHSQRFCEWAQEMDEKLGRPVRLYHNPSGLDFVPLLNAAVSTVKSDIIVYIVQHAMLQDKRWLKWLTTDLHEMMLQGVAKGLEEKVKYIAADSAFAIYKSAWDRLGGYDPEYSEAFADVDFSWRAYLVGFEVSWCKSGFGYSKVNPRPNIWADYLYGQQIFKKRLANPTPIHEKLGLIPAGD